MRANPVQACLPHSRDTRPTLAPVTGYLSDLAKGVRCFCSCGTIYGDIGGVRRCLGPSCITISKQRWRSLQQATWCQFCGQLSDSMWSSTVTEVVNSKQGSDYVCKY